VRADLTRVRQEVLRLLHGLQAKEPEAARPTAREHTLLSRMQTRLEAVEARLAAVEQWLAAGEQRLGTGPDTTDLDEQIGQVCREKESAIGAKDYEQAAALRNREKELLAAKAARQEQWAARQLELPDLAERVQQLTDEAERLRALLRQHGIDTQDKPA